MWRLKHPCESREGEKRSRPDSGFRKNASVARNCQMPRGRSQVSGCRVPAPKVLRPMSSYSPARPSRVRDEVAETRAPSLSIAAQNRYKPCPVDNVATKSRYLHHGRTLPRTCWTRSRCRRAVVRVEVQNGASRVLTHRCFRGTIGRWFGVGRSRIDPRVGEHARRGVMYIRTCTAREYRSLGANRRGGCRGRYRYTQRVTRCATVINLQLGDPAECIVRRPASAVGTPIA